ncbi:MAG: hypothetical protein OEW12_00820 [Deltaproteobacteria bacterium]|nr:hypothetical protein [Deltaproteobacteria bacterium]
MLKPKNIVIVGGILIFVVGLTWALLREVRREEEKLNKSVAGVVSLDLDFAAKGMSDVVKSDRLVLMLLDPETGEIRGMKIEPQALPPQVFIIGEENLRGMASSSGEYRLVALTDKDGEISKPSPGEVIGVYRHLVKWGQKEVQLMFNRPFTGSYTP